MFSVLKKLVGSDQPPLRDKNIPAGLQSMNQALQRRFAKGVQYNMKIVIRGDRNTGKTTLWHRLQGKKFVEDYIPTQEIQVTSIHWNYKTTDDIVKVEVWDVVDKGKCKKRGEGLKLENEPQEPDGEMALDAEFLDVYKNCNGVVMMFDITKQWTFNYILRELPKVPTHVPVCVLGNHRDMGEHRVILPDDVRECIQSLNRRPGSSYIRYAESSMKNSFGLKYLHKFFNIPFLQLQRETLLRQLETNQLDIDATLEELSVQQETEDQNYELFLEMMEVRNRGPSSPSTTNGQSSPSGSQSPVIPPSSASTDSSSPGTPLQLPQQVLSIVPSSTSSPTPTSPAPVNEVLPPQLMPPSAASPPPTQVAAPQQRRSIMSRLFGSSAPEASPSKAEEVIPSDNPPVVQSVEDFVPEDSLDRSFLEDTTPQKDKDKAESRRRHDSDSEGEILGGNPMVAGFQDDLDPDDQAIEKPSSLTAHIPSNSVVLSSEEEEEPKVSVMTDEDFDWDLEIKGSSKNSIKPQNESAFTKVMEPNLLFSSSLVSAPEKNSSAKLSTDVYAGMALTPQAVSSQAPKPHTAGQVSATRHKGKEGGNTESDSELEGPIATQLLSFVMDDPDFESEDSDKAAKKVDDFPVREDISDISEEDLATGKHAETLKPTTVQSFKLKNDSDLFGLGIIDKATKESSDEATESKSHSKEKKKKKKKVKEPQEEDKTGKKKSKPKKAKGKEEDKEDKKKRKKKTKENNEFDELEAFLGGREAIVKAGGDYEEL
ncbi:rab-like protein 6 isoform X1 [Lissotriton helveticus]